MDSLASRKFASGCPVTWKNASKRLRNFGQCKCIDERVTAINRAAESAVPLGKDLLVGAVRSMNVNNAQNILTRVDTSHTAFFADGLHRVTGEEKKKIRRDAVGTGSAMLQKVFGMVT